MTDLLDALEARAHRTHRGDPRAIYRAAVAEADAPLALVALAADQDRPGRRRPQRVALAALVASVALLAVGIAWIGATRDEAAPVAGSFPAGDVRFGPLAPPEGFELSAVRHAMFGPPPEVRVMTTVYAPDPEATASITVLVRRGATSTPDLMMPDGAATEIIGGHEVRIADLTRTASGTPIAGWDRRDGSRVFVVGQGVTTDDVRRAIPDLAIDGDDLATVAALPAGFERRFAGDGTDSLFAVTGSETFLLQYEPVDGSEREVSVESVPGAGFEPLAVRWLDPSVEPASLPDGTPAFLASDGRTWIKVLPEGVAVVNSYQVGGETDVASVVARVRSLSPAEWEAAVGDTEVVEGLIVSGSYTEAVATVPGWSTEPAP